MKDRQTKVTKISAELMNEIAKALKNIKGWGSVEIVVQAFKVVQITERNIKKTSHDIVRRLGS